MATPTDSRLGASTNGDLVNRVQQLRLDNQLGAGKARGGGSLLPWVLCALLAITWVGVGVRWYKSPKQNDAPAGATTGQEDLKAYQAAQAKLREAEERLKQMQADLEAKKPDATPEKVKELTDEVAKLKKAMPAGQQGAAPGEMVTQLKGIVIPSLQITVSPRDVVAEITDIRFSEGKRVQKGDVLATLLDQQYANRLKTDEASVTAAEAMIARAEASKVSAEAKLAKSKSALAAAEARLTRAKALQVRADADFKAVQPNTGVIPSQDYRKLEADKLAADADKLAADADLEAAKLEVKASEAEVTTAAANLASAKADLKAAEARRDEAQRLVKNCTVIAPIDGTILTKLADRGALISPMSFNIAPGICTIADLSKLEVEIDVPERQVMRVRPGQDCVLQADADPIRAYHGVVDRVMPIADDTKNVVKVRIRVYLPKDEEQGTFLKPKMGITATVYQRPFSVSAAGDFLWGDEEQRKPVWEKGYKGK